jgi:hypothetical protein
MTDADNPWPTQAADEARLVELASALAVAVEVAVPRWVERTVSERMHQWAGNLPPEVADAATAAGGAAATEVGEGIRQLLSTDIDEQRMNPLQLLRSLVPIPTAILRDAGVSPVERDPFVQERFPDDLYDLAPATWADIDPALQEPGLTWSAAKAFVFKARRRAGRQGPGEANQCR